MNANSKNFLRIKSDINLKNFLRIFWIKEVDYFVSSTRW